MSSRFLSVIVACGLQGLICPFEFAFCDPPVFETVKQVLESDTPYALAKAHYALKNATEEELARLVSHSHCSVSLAAGWERVRRSVPREKQEQRIDRQELARFLGLVEGRTQVCIPTIWDETLLLAKAYGRGNIVFPHNSEALLDHLSTLAAAGPKGVLDKIHDETYIDCGLERKADNYLISTYNHKWSVTCKPKSHFGYDKASILLVSNEIYLVLYGPLDDGLSLYAVDQNGNVRWSADIWGYGGFGSVVMPPGQYVELRKHEGKITAFGIGISIYIEAFDTKSGASLWRFSSKYAEFEDDNQLPNH